MTGYNPEMQIFETHVLKVHINCEGCEQKVRKLLNKIEGVYSVTIEKEQELVIVSGCVDSETLVKKLAKSGKVAEVWLPNTEHFGNRGPGEVHQIQANDLNPTGNQYKFPAYFGNDNENIQILENYGNQNIGMKTVNPGIDHGAVAETMMNNYNVPNVERGISNVEDQGDLNSSIIHDMYVDQLRMSNSAIHMIFSPDNYLPHAAPQACC